VGGGVRAQGAHDHRRTLHELKLDLCATSVFSVSLW